MPPRRSLAVPLVMLALALAACASEARPAPPPPKPASGAASGDAATGAAAAAPAPTVAARPTMQTFHLAGQFAATDAGIYVAMERGYFAEQGVDLEYVNFGSASEMVPALATRQSDGGGIAVNSATINAAARGVEIKAVADKGLMAPGFGWLAFLIRKDLVDSGRFQGAADLKGLV